MLRELDLDKNDKETIKEVLNFIADKLEEYVGESNGYYNRNDTSI